MRVYPIPDPDYQPEPICPICGDEFDDAFFKDGEFVGCDHCLTKKSWEDLPEFWKK